MQNIRYATILADPPWSTFQSSKHHMGGHDRFSSAIDHYHLMSTDEIAAMPIKDIAAENAHLYLWVTNGALPDGLKVMEAWGFRYITLITWIKPCHMGLGNYYRNNTEQILFGVRGRQPILNHSQPTFFFENYDPKQHSKKPIYVYPMIEKCSPAPYLELFCRERPRNVEYRWACWGDQCERYSDIDIPGYPVPKKTEQRF